MLSYIFHKAMKVKTNAVVFPLPLYKVLCRQEIHTEYGEDLGFMLSSIVISVFLLSEWNPGMVEISVTHKTWLEESKDFTPLY